MADYPDWFVQLIQSIKNKRPRIVAQHILEHGSVTTEELEDRYGYKHAPRAARDLRELGIPLETSRVKNSDGRSIAAYTFGDLSQLRHDRLTGRRNFPKAFKTALISHYGERCSICRGEFEARYLQIDHRIPYEVAGERLADERQIHDYQLLCGECNRAKSWSCEHCPNWLQTRDPQICLTCYWAQPDSYSHIGLRVLRRIDLVWAEDELESYQKLLNKALLSSETLPDYVKRILNNFADSD